MSDGLVVHLGDLVRTVSGTLLVVYLDLELLFEVVPALVVGKALVEGVVFFEVGEYGALDFVFVEQLLSFFTQHCMHFRGLLYSEPTLLSRFKLFSVSDICL